MDRTVTTDRLTAHSFQAMVTGEDGDGDLVFVIRETADGWKTEGHPAFDGLLPKSLDDLVRQIEGRD